MDKRKNFIHRNDSFTCQNCNFQNMPQQGSCRNHCSECLFSKHVDLETPGDRLSHCHAMMEPLSLDYSGKKGEIIIHQCKKCGKIMRNTVADDDNRESIIHLSTITSENAHE